MSNPVEYKVRVWDNGVEEWMLDAKYHREDGPALKHSNGDKFWYLNGKLHRTDGPAVEWANGYKAWWFNGINYLTEAKWTAAVNPTTCKGKVVEIDGKRYKLTEIKNC